jgi:ATP-dependent Clp protease ATP-binding subunit ClpA
VTDPTARQKFFIDEMHIISRRRGARAPWTPPTCRCPRGELHAVSHHAKEYQKYIGRSDKALERRFQVVMVDEFILTPSASCAASRCARAKPSMCASTTP